MERTNFQILFKKMVKFSKFFRNEIAKKMAHASSDNASVKMVHAEPSIKLSKNEALEIGKKDLENLVKQKKLVLLVDLDHTLIHTTNDNVSNELKVIDLKLNLLVESSFEMSLFDLRTFIITSCGRGMSGITPNFGPIAIFFWKKSPSFLSSTWSLLVNEAMRIRLPVTWTRTNATFMTEFYPETKYSIRYLKLIISSKIDKNFKFS